MGKGGVGAKCGKKALLGERKGLTPVIISYRGQKTLKTHRIQGIPEYLGGVVWHSMVGCRCQDPSLTVMLRLPFWCRGSQMAPWLSGEHRAAMLAL